MIVFLTALEDHLSVGDGLAIIGSGLMTCFILWLVMR